MDPITCLNIGLFVGNAAADLALVLKDCYLQQTDAAGKKVLYSSAFRMGATSAAGFISKGAQNMTQHFFDTMDESELRTMDLIQFFWKGFDSGMAKDFVKCVAPKLAFEFNTAQQVISIGRKLYSLFFDW